MGVKFGILFIAIFAGCLVDSLPNPTFIDKDFYNVDSGARIVGGTPAAEGSVPYMAGLIHGTFFRGLLCGASILTQRSILTAAHCIDAVYFEGALSRTLAVTVGTNRWETGGQTYRVLRNVTHQHYVEDTLKNDIGLLITTTNIIFSNVVVPVVPIYDFVPSGVTARAVGWGRTTFMGPGSPVLLELMVTTIDGERCRQELERAGTEYYGIPPPFEDHIELCAFHSVNHGICHGDSGSPLVRADNGRLIGVVSWIVPCARGFPDMFVRVSAFRDWILQHLV